MVAAVITRQVDLAFDNMVQVLPQIQGGKMRALAVTSRTRDRSLPDVPSMIELGFKDFEITTWIGVWTTGGSPAEAVARLESEMRKVLASPEFAAATQKTGLIITNLGSRELAKIVEDEAVRWDKILKFAGVKPG
jgi:tripartite-type tricarboxylate transporter receptor subunit TctC